MSRNVYSLGIDFGTNSVRALILDLENGEEIASGVQKYPGGDQGVFTARENAHLARQYPGDYIKVLEHVVKTVVKKVVKKTIHTSDICGISIGATASTPLPVQKDVTPVAFLSPFRDNLNAYAWLWKDHTSVWEAKAITELAEKIRPEYLAKCRGTYSN